MTNKQAFFNKLEEKKAVQAILDGLHVEYNELVFAEDKDGELEFNNTASRHYNSRLGAIDFELKAMREQFTEDELKEMKKEYYAR